MSKFIKILLVTITVATLWFISLKLVCEKTKRDIPPSARHYEPLFRTDTIVKLSWEFDHFQFYLKHITEHGLTESAFATIHLKSTDDNYELFNCHRVIDMMNPEPKLLVDNIYSFPYYSGGNYSRAEGIELFRVASDTVIYIGPVCGYEDMDEDGINEFYINIVSELGEYQAANKYERRPVELIGDSLSYGFLDGSY